jgi:hypothetical protein
LNDPTAALVPRRDQPSRSVPDTDLPLAGIAISPELVAMLKNDPGGTADIRAFSCHLEVGEPETWSPRIRPCNRRMGIRPPMPSRPVQNRDTIASLIVVGAMLLDADVGGEAFTLEQLTKKMRELLRPGQILAADDVRCLLPGMAHCLAPALDRWRWKRRESVYQG